MTLAHPFQVAAYFPEWEVTRPYYVKHIASRGSADKISLINYAFGLPAPDPATGAVIASIDNAGFAYAQVYSAEMSIDGQPDDPHAPLRGHFNQLRKLKALYPHIKVVVSLGGWTGCTWFSDAARTPETRAAFVRSCVDLYIHGNLPPFEGAGGPGAAAGVFDGIDIDWEYPVRDGLPTNHYHPDDAQNYVLLLEEFRRQYASAGRPDLLLTSAVPGPQQAGLFNMPEAHPLLDWVALMTYDLWGSWKPLSGHHTSLYNSEYDPQPVEQRASADSTVRLYRDSFGVPPEKILLGAAFYGRGWGEVGPAHHGLYQPGQTLTGMGSNYYDLLDYQKAGFERHWDEDAQAPWLYSPSRKIFFSYDDPQSLALKAGYAREHGLGGVMFWEISADDPAGTLVDALDRGLRA